MSNTYTLPINPTSFGQISLMLLHELHAQGEDILLNPITDLQLEHENNNGKFRQWLNNCISNFYPKHNKCNPSFRLWHINQSLNFVSQDQTLLTFHETDSLTESEINILNNQDRVFVTCDSSLELFREETRARINKIHLPFDKYNFHNIEKRNIGDDRIVFTLVGKYEPLRKRHDKVIAAWLKEFGDNKKYELRCAISNHFYDEEEFKHSIRRVLNNKNYFNISFIGWLVQNNLYNDFLNQGDIVIGMGNESWGLPEFHSVALGKHSVILDCLGHSEWATDENSCLVKPSGMIPADNDKFFQKGHAFNQGNFYDFDETSFIEACYKAIERYENNPVNEEGKKIQNTFTTKKFVDDIKQYM